MKHYLIIAASIFILGACQSATKIASNTDQCGASKYQYLVGGLSSATHKLKISSNSRHYGRKEQVAMDMPSRLNFVHSGTDIESVTNPKSKVIRVFCG